MIDNARAMSYVKCVALVTIAVLVTLPAQVNAQLSSNPDTVTVTTGTLRLRGLIWRPRGSGPFPAAMFNHGSYSTTDPMSPDEPATVGPVFARHGYVFLFLFRQGTGLSVGQGIADGDQMARALKEKGQEGRNDLQLQLLESDEMNEALAGMALLRAQPDVEANRVAVVGHSFGGSLSLLMLARDSTLRAAIIFGGAARSWSQSPALRSRLLTVVRQTSAHVFFIHAANDYSTAPGTALAMEMKRARKPHRLKIYPAVGNNTREGHNLVYRSVTTWERDVFAFLATHLYY